MRSAIQPYAISYMTLRRLMGLQRLFRFSLFGMKVIMPNLFGSENCIYSVELSIVLVIKELISVQNNFKNSHVNP